MKKLTIPELRSIYGAAVRAVQPAALFRDCVRLRAEDSTLEIRSPTSILDDPLRSSSPLEVRLTGRDIYLFGAGKAVLGMAEAFLDTIDHHNNHSINPQLQRIKIRSGRLNVPIGSAQSIAAQNLFHQYNVSAHQCAAGNIPDEAAVQNTDAILRMIDHAKWIPTNVNKNPKSESESENPPDSSLPPLIIGFISGGGSALLSRPRSPITIAQKRELIQALTRRGADIVELNTVRGAISEVKCGELARRIINSNSNSKNSKQQQCQLITFIISDIINDPIERIASGPTVISTERKSKSSPLSPLNILAKYGLVADKQDQIEPIIIDTIAQFESTEPYQINPDLVHNILIGNNLVALRAAEAEATRAMNLRVISLGSNISGEAVNVVDSMLGQVRNYQPKSHKNETYRGICWIGGGETTITMMQKPKMKIKVEKNENGKEGEKEKSETKIGLGGRCQEMGLLAIQKLLSDSKNENIFCNEITDLKANANRDPETGPRLHLLFAGTDGQDGPTSAAGVLITWPARFEKYSTILDDINRAIDTHDSYHFYERHLPSALIRTGVSGTNVMDIYCVIYEF